LNRVLAAVVSFFSALGVACAAVDANTASPSELESISGIGPATSARIVEERRREPFRDTQDLMRRVKGIGEAKLRKMVAAGLTVGGNAALITAGGSGQSSARRGEVIEIGACADRGPPVDRPKQGDRAAPNRQ
jgi:competence protein ComEA